MSEQIAQRIIRDLGVDDLVDLLSESGRPQIVMLYCRARVVARGSQEWPILIGQFPSHFGQRQVIVGDVEFVQTSCGYAAPEMKFVSRRETLTRWAEAKGDEGLVEYRRMHK